MVPSMSTHHPSPIPKPFNVLGLLGLLFAILGLCTCILSPVGLVLSFLGLFKQPPGLAIAGFVISLIGTAVLTLVLLLATFVPNTRNPLLTVITLALAQQKIMDYEREQGQFPDTVEGNKLIAEITDAWGNPIRYDLDGDDFIVRSAGADGQMATPDDMTTETVNSSF